MKLTDYRYSCTKYGWEITYQGTIVAGWSVNVNLLTEENKIDRYEYHRDCAKESLLKLIQNEKS